MSEETTIKEISLAEKLENLGLDINQIPQVSYNDLRLDLVREAGVFEGAFGKKGGDTLWQAFNKNRTNFYAGNRWAQSITPNGDISLLHAVPQSNRYNIFDIAKNGEIKMSRFTNGQWNWTIENAGELNKTYKSSKGTIICHFEDETTKTKIVLRQPSIGVKDVERVISYDKNIKQRMVSYHKVIDGKRVVCDAEGNVLKKGIAQTLAHTSAEGKILQSAKMEKVLMEKLQNMQTTPHKFPSVADIKGMEKQAEQTVTSATEKVATKSAMKATAAKAGEKVAKTAKTAGKAAKETLLAANKAYDDTFDAIMKWGDKHAPQWMNKVEEKTVQKAAEKFMKTKSGQAIAKQIEKKVGKEIAASIAKKIPILCLGVGAVCVYDRVKEGEYLKAVGEGVSALVANVPGLGTLASFGLDGAMLSDDLKVFEHGVMPKDPNSHVAAESTFVERPEICQDKLVRKVDKVAEAKKKAAEAKKKEESKKKAQKFEANLYRYGGNSGNFFGG